MREPGEGEIYKHKRESYKRGKRKSTHKGTIYILREHKIAEQGRKKLKTQITRDTWRCDRQRKTKEKEPQITETQWQICQYGKDTRKTRNNTTEDQTARILERIKLQPRSSVRIESREPDVNERMRNRKQIQFDCVLTAQSW